MKGGRSWEEVSRTAHEPRLHHRGSCCFGNMHMLLAFPQAGPTYHVGQLKAVIGSLCKHLVHLLEFFIHVQHLLAQGLPFNPAELNLLQLHQVQGSCQEILQIQWRHAQVRMLTNEDDNSCHNTELCLLLCQSTSPSTPLVLKLSSTNGKGEPDPTCPGHQWLLITRPSLVGPADATRNTMPTVKLLLRVFRGQIQSNIRDPDMSSSIAKNPNFRGINQEETCDVHRYLNCPKLLLSQTSMHPSGCYWPCPASLLC